MKSKMHRFAVGFGAMAAVTLLSGSTSDGDSSSYTPVAQNPPPAVSGPSNPAVKTTEGNNSALPVAGANSFAENQATSRIESRGYANVSDLHLDNSGVARGKAQMSGQPVGASLDYQGNVVAN